MRCNTQSVKSILRSVRPLNDPYGSNKLNKPLTDRYDAGVLDNPPHPRDKCPAKDATCTFCGKQGHFERACLQKKGIDKSTNLQAKSKHQLAVGVDPDEDSIEYDSPRI